MKAYHVTWVTHNSRVSERMVTFGVRRGAPVLLDEAAEREIAGYLAEIVKQSELRVLAANICRDHVHMLLVCPENKLTDAVKTLKGKSAYLYKKARAISEPVHLWAQKFHREEMRSEIQLERVMHYITFNRQKHQLPDNKGLKPLVASILTSHDKAFAPTKKPNETPRKSPGKGLRPLVTRYGDSQ